MSTENKARLIINELKSHYNIRSDSDFASFLGIAPQTLSSWKSRNNIDYDLIYSKCVGVNATFLLTGSGVPFLTELNEGANKGFEISDTVDSTSNQIQLIHNPKSSERINDEQVVYLYNIEATAGLREILDNKTQNILDAIIIPDLPKCDGAIRVTGDSMYPILKSGDIVLFKEVTDIKYVFWGEMYLLSLSVDDEEYITVKYIQKSDIDQDHIRLVSHNQNHNAKDVPIADIRAIAIVKASIRFNTIA